MPTVCLWLTWITQDLSSQFVNLRVKADFQLFFFSREKRKRWKPYRSLPKRCSLYIRLWKSLFSLSFPFELTNSWELENLRTARKSRNRKWKLKSISVMSARVLNVQHSSHIENKLVVRMEAFLLQQSWRFHVKDCTKKARRWHRNCCEQHSKFQVVVKKFHQTEGMHIKAAPQKHLAHFLSFFLQGKSTTYKLNHWCVLERVECKTMASKRKWIDGATSILKIVSLFMDFLFLSISSPSIVCDPQFCFLNPNRFEA